MENEKSLVKQEAPQSFIERLIEHAEDLEKIKEVGMVIINSGFCPEHFKQSKDAVGAIMCIEAGRKLGLTWMQSLSDIYPVKGRIGIMGSAARAVIFGCGVLEKWEEITEGVYPLDTYKHIIISKRKDLPGMFRSEFSVYDAKKAGLFTKDIYQRYGKRMIMWRNIGFHANDYYGDIMKGMKTVEELNDFDVIPGIGDTTIENEDGTKIKIQAGSKGKSTKMTERVADKIPDNRFATDAEIIKENKPAAVTQTVMQPTVINESHPVDESPFIPTKDSTESMNGVRVIRDASDAITNMDEINAASQGENTSGAPGELTLAVMEKMETSDLLKIINENMDTIEAMEVLPGKNTGKKLREIIFAHKNGKLTDYVAALLPKPGTPTKEQLDAPPLVNTETGEILINKNFDNQGAPKKELFPGELEGKKETSANKYGIEIPPYDKGNSRDFAAVKTLFNKMMGVTPQITTPRYMEIALKLGFLEKYADKEKFCRDASVIEINLLLDSN